MRDRHGLARGGECRVVKLRRVVVIVVIVAIEARANEARAPLKASAAHAPKVGAVSPPPPAIERIHGAAHFGTLGTALFGSRMAALVRVAVQVRVAPPAFALIRSAIPHNVARAHKQQHGRKSETKRVIQEQQERQPSADTARR